MARLLSCLLLAAAFASAAWADVTVTILNNDDPGEGFNDPTVVAAVGINPETTLGAQRLFVFNQAGVILSNFLDSNVEIIVRSNFDPLFCDAQFAQLGLAGAALLNSNFPGADRLDTWYHVALANRLTGRDLDPNPPEGSVGHDVFARFNTLLDSDDNCLGGTDWYYGADANAPFGTLDLLQVVLHEIAHGIGFSNFVDERDGTSPLDLPDIYTVYTFDTTTNEHWDTMTEAERVASAINTGNVVWDGPHVTAATGFLTSGADGQGRLRFFTPNPVAFGSSISHWIDTASPDLLMEPSIGNVSGYGLDLTDEQLFDVGWEEGRTGIFLDGFESGDLTLWSSTVQ
ncbi:MAG: hypothetical protein AAF604_08240 [Acidobacteriota bacterium]